MVKALKFSFSGLIKTSVSLNDILMKKILFLKLIVISLISIPVQVFCQFAGGDGTEEAPFHVESLDQLQDIRNHLDKHFIQIENINAFETKDWNEGKGFIPVGKQGAEFRGTFDGNGYEIRQLTINRPDEDAVGLFGLSNSANFQRIKLEDANITGRYYTGTAVGWLLQGVILNSFASGKVVGSLGVGGLIGRATNSTIESLNTSIGVYSNVKAAGGVVGLLERSDVSDSHSNGDIFGLTEAGGLIGSSEDGNISNSTTSSKVEGNNDKFRSRSTGGFIGIHTGGEITASHASGTVSSNGGSIGGFVGTNHGNISNSYSVGQVIGGEERAGGFAGSMHEGIISNSYSTGSVTGEGQSYGGFIGSISSGEIIDSYASGNVTSMSDYVGGFCGSFGGDHIRNSSASGDVDGRQFIGGFIGSTWGSGEISNSKAHGIVNGTGGLVGGFVGNNDGSVITESSSTSVVTGSGDYVGGFAGFNNKDIYNSSAKGNVDGSGDYVGGFAGMNLERVIRSYSDNEVSGAGENIGGLIGYSGGTVSESYALGKVLNGQNNVGGLLGSLDGELIDSYSLAPVHGETNVGGLVGKNFEIGSIYTSYSAGKVTGSQQAGGLVGYNDGVTENNYWNVEISGENEAVGSGSPEGISGLTDSEMKGISAIDFMNTLKFDEIWISYEDEFPTHLWSVSHFKIDEITFNSPIGIGQSLKLDMKIKNIGGVADTQYVRLKNETGVIIDEINSLDLNGKESKLLALQWETNETDEGSYEFTLHTEKDEKSIMFSVRSAPSKVVLKSPANHEIVERIPVFEWEPAELSETYQLQLSKDPEFDQLVRNFENVSVEAFKLADSLDSSEQHYWRVRSISEFGNGEWSNVWSFTTEMATSNDIEELPEQYSLLQNYPNPFNPITTIKYSLPKSSWVSLRVYNLLGHEIVTLVDNELKGPGSHDILFDASDLSSGTYLYNLSTNGFTDIKKFTLIK